jgi:hypothetical protein
MIWISSASPYDRTFWPTSLTPTESATKPRRLHNQSSCILAEKHVITWYPLITLHNSGKSPFIVNFPMKSGSISIVFCKRLPGRVRCWNFQMCHGPWWAMVIPSSYDSWPSPHGNPENARGFDFEALLLRPSSDALPESKGSCHFMSFHIAENLGKWMKKWPVDRWFTMIYHFE